MYRSDLMKRMWVTRHSVDWPLFWQFWLIELLTSNEWMWSYKPWNCIRLDSNERCESPLPTSNGLRWWWRQNCSKESSKVGNLVSHDWNIIVQKLILFWCVHTQRYLYEFLSRVDKIYLKIKRLEMDSRTPKIL